MSRKSISSCLTKIKDPSKFLVTVFVTNDPELSRELRSKEELDSARDYLELATGR